MKVLTERVAQVNPDDEDYYDTLGFYEKSEELLDDYLYALLGVTFPEGGIFSVELRDLALTNPSKM